LGINGARPHLFGPIYSLRQKQHVFEPYGLSLSSMVAKAISLNIYLDYNNRLSQIWKCCEGYIKKEENRAALLLDTKMKSEYYFFFK
jgi:hypothetical protein